jgi:hypothetical protein
MHRRVRASCLFVVAAAITAASCGGFVLGGFGLFI